MSGPLFQRTPLQQAFADLRRHLIATEPDTINAVGQLVGTLPYISPEMLQDQGATSASDVFALGCMLVEAFTGRRPWQQPGLPSVMERLSVPPDLHGLAGSTLGELVSAMLALSPVRDLLPLRSRACWPRSRRGNALCGDASG